MNCFFLVYGFVAMLLSSVIRLSLASSGSTLIYNSDRWSSLGLWGQ